MEEWPNPDYLWRPLWVFWFYQIKITLHVTKLATFFIETLSFYDEKISKLGWNLWWNMGILGIWSKIIAGLVACVFLVV